MLTENLKKKEANITILLEKKASRAKIPEEWIFIVVSDEPIVSCNEVKM